MGSPFDVQLGTSRSRSAFGDQFKLRLDPNIQAEIDKLHYKLDFDRLQSQWYQPDWSSIDWLLQSPSLMAMPQPLVSPSLFPKATPAPFPVPAPCDSSSAKSVSDPPNPSLRKGEVSDVLKAVWKLPMVEAGVSDLKCELGSQWNRMGTGGQAIVITSSVVIGGSLLAGIAANQSSRTWALQKISGVEIPVPKVDGLSFSLVAPNGIITGGGLQYENKLFDAKAGYERMTLPDNTRFNNVTVSINLNVSEAIDLIKKLTK